VLQRCRHPRRLGPRPPRYRQIAEAHLAQLEDLPPLDLNRLRDLDLEEPPDEAASRPPTGN
jgi:hypothetical protein